MLRLRRMLLSDRWFFIACRLLPRRRHLSDPEFATLAQVIAKRRPEHRFLLTAWVFLPDRGHAIFYPRHPPTRVMEAIKDGATKRINHSRGGMAKKSRRGTQKARTSALPAPAAPSLLRKAVARAKLPATHGNQLSIFSGNVPSVPGFPAFPTDAPARLWGSVRSRADSPGTVADCVATQLGTTESTPALGENASLTLVAGKEQVAGPDESVNRPVSGRCSLNSLVEAFAPAPCGGPEAPGTESPPLRSGLQR
jgi:REP element-mobilizing transposase RayT